jgi:hypothetical protein
MTVWYGMVGINGDDEGKHTSLGSRSNSVSKKRTLNAARPTIGNDSNAIVIGYGYECPTQIS